MICPPISEVPLPTLISISPPLPPVDAPVAKDSRPLAPDDVVPVLKVKIPVAPVAPASTERIVIEPDESAKPDPDATDSNPPVRG